MRVYLIKKIQQDKIAPRTRFARGLSYATGVIYNAAQINEIKLRFE